jgi:spore germination cell wall hydrolase CwlJ-like protein
MFVTRSNAAVAVLAFALMPVQIGHQDFASLIPQRPRAPERAHLIASPFGTIHAALLTMPHPAGSQIPEPIGYRLASLGPNALDTTGSNPMHTLFDARSEERAAPEVDRTLKGDRLVPRAQPQQRGADAGPPESAASYTLASLTPVPADLGDNGETSPKIADDAELAAAVAKEPATSDSDLSAEESNPDGENARIFFGIESMRGMPGAMQPWAPGAGLMLDIPGAADDSAQRADPPSAGESIVSKGEVTGPDKRPQSPAERLGLEGKSRAKAEKCLADAVYFEARGESVRGQMAVAQVVMNRVFSGYYPDTVCGVVYQNAHHRDACQFSFACDGVPERVNEPEAWTRAKQIAHGTLDGKLWLPDVGKATHYHAYWVHPWWVRTMRKLDKIGVHTFYRPRRWGSGADEPIWGDATATTEAVQKL